MLSGDGNENVMCSRRFWYISLPLFCTTTTWNVQTLPSYTFYRGLKFSFSHRCYKIFKFFFQWNWPPLFFCCFFFYLSLYIELFLSESELLLFYFFSLKVQVAMQFTAETLGSLKCKISPRLSWTAGRTYATYGRFCQNQNFLNA